VSQLAITGFHLPEDDIATINVEKAQVGSYTFRRGPKYFITFHVVPSFQNITHLFCLYPIFTLLREREREREREKILHVNSP
jgi:hypothetical protein